LAAFLARQGRITEAVAIVDQAWETCQPDVVAVMSLPLYLAASAGEDLKRQGEARITAAMQKSPIAAAALRPKLAELYLRQGRYDEAEALDRQTLASDSEHVEALNTLAWLLVVRDASKTAEALDLVNRAIEKRGRLSSLVDTRAVALIRAAKVDESAQEIREAQALDPANPSLAIHLAWAYHEAGKTDAARDAFQRAESLGLKLESRDPLERRIIERLRAELAARRAATSARGHTDGT
jgi:tetratricopeptide (TPR) repeat protein